MAETVKAYVSTVMDNLVVEAKLKKRIEADLLAQIAEESENSDVALVLERMGPPEAVAREFMDSIYEDKTQIIDSLISEEIKAKELAYEYKSRYTFLGWPLVHINCRRSGKVRVAKGIIAIGDVAVGLVSIGGLALGGIGLGGISLALFSFGGISLGLMALGGLAVGQAAIGGLAIGKIAQGGLAVGKVAIGGKAIGNYVMEGQSGAVTGDEVIALVKSAYPGLGDWLINLLTLPLRFLLKIK